MAARRRKGARATSHWTCIVCESKEQGCGLRDESYPQSVRWLGPSGPRPGDSNSRGAGGSRGVTCNSRGSWITDLTRVGLSSPVYRWKYGPRGVDGSSEGRLADRRWPRPRDRVLSVGDGSAGRIPPRYSHLVVSLAGHQTETHGDARCRRARYGWIRKFLHV